MEATLLLCDFAAVAEGKMYISGACWSQTRADFPVTMGLAIYLKVPWDQTNRPHTLLLRLVNEDGVEIKNDEGKTLGAEAQLEVGRPPGLRQGVNLDAPMALNFNNLILAEAGYRWELIVDDEQVAVASFQARKFANG